MEEGQTVKFEKNGNILYGKIIKIYKETGYDRHEKMFAVISIYDNSLRFYEGDVSIELKKIIE
tara:strand:+ start:1447 stop:1635 length:189 start_codon:yes stop_codon:yes gene_type:complete